MHFRLNLTTDVLGFELGLHIASIAWKWRGVGLVFFFPRAPLWSDGRTLPESASRSVRIRGCFRASACTVFFWKEESHSHLMALEPSSRR